MTAYPALLVAFLAVFGALSASAGIGLLVDAVLRMRDDSPDFSRVHDDLERARREREGL